MTVKITLLGTGDTTGTPLVGCTCPVCTEAGVSGRERLRTSLLVEHEGFTLLIDTSPDLRRQLLREGSPHIDAVLWTHGHYDHFAGYNDFYRVQKYPPGYGAPEVVSYMQEQFHFINFAPHPQEPYVPFTLGGLRITLGEVNHPPTPTYGMLIEDGDTRIGYTADTNRDIPQRTKDLLSGCDLFFADALFPVGIRHPKHMNYSDAVALAEELEAKDFRLVHLSHKIPWDAPHIGYDGDTFVI